ncbi:outer membrane protein TolC [Chitinophaga skermanii]|uniref:Outer membrane protein TolC n=1 Tax=Chitinophaga skermanii TaxID=331697 RepID=A0A327R445_9BACT|nr:TolC family protein [Chitinophaga skermanii]RAJ10985.1 outer membrane protein TolC [Chitinophaga skermanii]
MKKIFYSLFALASLVAVNAQAQQVPSDLQTLVNQSFDHFADIKAMKAQQAIAGDRTQITKASRLPEVNGSLQYQHLYPVPKMNLGDAVFQAIPSESLNVGVTGRQLLLDFGKSNSVIDHAKAQQNLLGIQTEEAKEILAYQVANVYLNIAFLTKEIEVQDANIKLLEETEKMVSNKLKNGDAIDLDLINTQVKLENYRNHKVEFESQLEKQMANLTYLTGVDYKEAIKNDFNWPAKTNVAPGDALTENASLKTALEQEKVAELDLKTAKSQYTPSLFLDAGTGIKNGYLPDVGTPKWNFNAGVTLNVPIYNGKKLRYQESIANHQLEIAKINTQGVNDKLRKDVATQNADIVSNQKKLQTSETLVKQAERALQLAQSRYKNGVVTYLDLQNAQTSVLEAQLSRIQYQYQLSISSLELLHLTGNQFWR